jgi:cell division protein FtsB
MKAESTYWNNSQTGARPAARRGKARAAKASSLPQWLVFAGLIALTSMLCITINLRAYKEVREEVNQNEILTGEVDRLGTENLAIQDEIHNLKSDTQTIEREARRLGLGKFEEKVSVPKN